MDKQINKNRQNYSEEEVRLKLKRTKELNSITKYINTIIQILKGNNIRKRSDERVMFILKNKLTKLSERTKMDYDTLIKLIEYSSNIIAKIETLKQFPIKREYYDQLSYMENAYNILKEELIKSIKDKKVNPSRLMSLCKSAGETANSMKAEELVYIGPNEIKEFLTNTISDIIANIQLIEVTTVEYLETLKEDS